MAHQGSARVKQERIDDDVNPSFAMAASGPRAGTRALRWRQVARASAGAGVQTTLGFGAFPTAPSIVLLPQQDHLRVGLPVHRCRDPRADAVHRSASRIVG